MDSRAKVLLESMIDVIQGLREDGYTREFANFLVKETGITEEELIECGAFNEEMLKLHEDREKE